MKRNQPTATISYREVLSAELEQLRAECPSESDVKAAEDLYAAASKRYQTALRNDKGRRQDSEALCDLSARADHARDYFRALEKKRWDCERRMQWIEVRLRASEQIPELEKALSAAERDLAAMIDARRRAEEALSAAEQHVATLRRAVESYEQTVQEHIRRGEPPPASPRGELGEATARLEDCRAIAKAAALQESRAYRVVTDLRTQLGQARLHDAEVRAAEALYPHVEALRALQRAALEDGTRKHVLKLPGGPDVMLV